MNDVDVDEKQNPPSRGTESLDVVTVAGFKLVAVVFCVDGKLNVTVLAGEGEADSVTGKVGASVDATAVVAVAVIVLLINDFSFFPSFC